MGRVRHAVGTAALVLAVLLAAELAAQTLLPAGAVAVFPLAQLVAPGAWYAPVALVAAVLGVLGRSRVAAALGLAVAFVQLALLAACWLPTNACTWGSGSAASGAVAVDGQVDAVTDASAAARELRVMSVNAYRGSADAAAIVALARDEGVELLCVQESSDALYAGLVAAGIYQLFPYMAGEVGGNQLWSALPLADAVADAVGYSGSAMPAGTVELGGTYLRVVSVHTCSPTPGYERYWLESLEDLAAVRERDALATAGAAYVLLGDFNATYAHAPFRDVLAAGFADGVRSAGEGPLATWPSLVGLPAVLGLDHVLVEQDAGVAVRDLDAVGIAGTDHRALLATLVLS
jgi:endonuclease/exonuclease/phosphatase family metal-dependent hydrolase